MCLLLCWLSILSIWIIGRFKWRKHFLVLRKKNCQEFGVLIFLSFIRRYFDSQKSLNKALAISNVTDSEHCCTVRAHHHVMMSQRVKKNITFFFVDNNESKENHQRSKMRKWPFLVNHFYQLSLFFHSTLSGSG